MKIKCWDPKKEEDIKSSKLGKDLLDNKKIVLISYKRKKWSIIELLNYLTNRIEKLEKNQCNPSADCLFNIETRIIDYALEESNREIL